MDFAVLKPTDPQWADALSDLPDSLRDIHFDADYARVQGLLGGEPLLLTLKTPLGRIAQPVIKRQSQPLGFFDIASAYGFGGPLSSSQNATDRINLSIAFQACVDKWAIEQDVLSEYTRLHPLFLVHQSCMLPAKDVREFKPIVVIALPQFSIDKVARRVRRGIMKAQGNVAFYEVEAAEIFVRLYSETMNRKNADARLRFTADYLRAHFTALRARQFAVTNRIGERRLIVMGRYRIAYAHLLASNGEARHDGLDEMLYFSVAERLRREGYQQFHLGGGLSDSPHDPLLAFKAGFAAPEYMTATYTRVFDQRRYDAACEAKRRVEFAEIGRESTAKFFPEFRRPTV